MTYQRIGVLLGGLSREREVSCKSGAAVAKGLRAAGYDVVEIDVTHRLDEQLRTARVEAVFIALHGRFGEDGTVQGMLEMMRIPYTGSSALASALAIDKHRTRQILQAAGLTVAPGVLLTSSDDRDLKGLRLPVVVKPVEEGSSVGVSIPKTAAELETGLAAAFACSRRVLVEQFVAGREVQVAVIDGEAVGAVEIEPHAEFYDYNAKYAPGGSTHHIPPRIPADQLSTALATGAAVYAAIGCSGAARVDLILPAEGAPVVLEINTIPGMTDRSLLPEIAAHAGIPFNELVCRLMESATLHVN